MDRDGSVYRNTYYDIVKGIVTINILLIHTACWSGVNYVPDYVRNLLLLFDVPCFFFVSGACQQYVKGIKKQMKSLVGLYIKWLSFLPIYWFLITIGGVRINFQIIIHNLMFDGETETWMLPVVMGSTWFWPVYFIVVFLGAIFVHEYNEQMKVGLICISVTYVILLIFWHFFRFIILKQSIKVIFYLMIFCWGYVTRESVLKRRYFVAAELMCMVIAIPYVFFPEKINVIGMLEAKAPPIVPYGIYSVMAILMIVYFRSLGASSRLLAWIGKNSLLLYRQ